LRVSCQAGSEDKSSLLLAVRIQDVPLKTGQLFAFGRTSPELNRFRRQLRKSGSAEKGFGGTDCDLSTLACDEGEID